MSDSISLVPIYRSTQQVSKIAETSMLICDDSREVIVHYKVVQS